MIERHGSVSWQIYNT